MASRRGRRSGAGALLGAVAVLAALLGAPRGAIGWNYNSGGSDWGGACSTGPQSPIDINVPAKEGGLDSVELEMYYPELNAWWNKLVFEHTGAALQLTANKHDLGYLYYAGHRHYLREVLFRSPSEHTIRGERFAMEMQIVHQRQGAKGDEGVVIVSALYRAVNNTDRGSAKFLDYAFDWNRLPSRKGKYNVMTVPSFQLGMGVDGLHAGFFRYVGSMTAPPCKTGVVWNVLETVQEMSVGQAISINRVFKDSYQFAKGHGNNRKLQSNSHRVVTLHNHKPVGDSDGRELPSCRASRAPEAAPPAKAQLTAAPEDIAAAPAQANKHLGNRVSAVPELYLHGGEDWDGLCKTGFFQSPIDIRPCLGNPHGDFEMQPAYTPANISVIKNNKWTVQAVGELGELLVSGQSGGVDKYKATAVQFHAPAEHTVDGRRAPLEMEIMHEYKSPTNGLEHAVVSVLFYESNTESSEFLENLAWGHLPTIPGSYSKLGKPVNLMLLKGLRGGYYSYVGSLSQPPCSQGVHRFVMRTVNPVSSFQLNKFRRCFDGNYRRIRKANYRGVMVQNVYPHQEAQPVFRNSPPVKA